MKKDEMIFFRKNAIIANLCKEWNDMWGACHDNKEKLTRLVLMRQSAPYFASFCYNGTGLTKEYCKREFADYINGRVFNDVDGVSGFTSAIYVDPTNGFKTGLDTVQMLWCNNVDVEIEETKCPTLYISNRSNVNLTLEGYSVVTIYLFDESKVNILDCDATCEIIVYKYSDNSDVELGKYCIGNVKVFNKTLRL